MCPDPFGYRRSGAQDMNGTSTSPFAMALLQRQSLKFAVGSKTNKRVETGSLNLFQLNGILKRIAVYGSQVKEGAAQVPWLALRRWMALVQDCCVRMGIRKPHENGRAVAFNGPC